MNASDIFKLIDERKDELFELLSSMIRINSENFRTHGNEQPMAEYVLDLCRELGLESTMYSPLELDGFTEHPDYMDGRHLENRYNVTACWKGVEDVNELMLMGHTDTVEIGDIANWDGDPLAGEIRDGKIFGRGACDDKYALATALFVIKILKEQGFTPKRNLLFSAYSDEEYGGSHGALAAVLKDPCTRIVSMDGVEGQIWHCGSGGQERIYRYHSKETVDSAKLAASALPIILEEMETFAARRRQELEQNRFYAGTIIPETSVRYMDIRAGNNGADLGTGSLLFTYYTDKTKDEIEAEFAELERVIDNRLDAMGLVGDGFFPNTRFFHYVFCEPDSEDVTLMVEAAREATGTAPIVCGSCLSDLSVISKYGSDRAYGFGIGRDFSLPGGAHQPNEYIGCDELVAYTKTIAAYVMKVLG
ncbi:MAG: M20 family metallopeptidase [Clostridia bacterium]|nr:M20 family metallopeptidase [Clostridia bacterium]